jgi:hypothetical protein
MDPLADASNRIGALQASGRSGSKRQRLEQLQSQQANFQHVVSTLVPVPKSMLYPQQYVVLVQSISFTICIKVYMLVLLVSWLHVCGIRLLRTPCCIAMVAV